MTRAHSFLIAPALSVLICTALPLASCSVDTENYRFVDPATLDGGAQGCANPACTECMPGFKKSGMGCVDVNECEEALDDCDDGPDACVNREDGLGFICECPMGFEGNGIGPDGCLGTSPCPEGTLDIKGDASECYRPFSAVSLGEAHGCGVRGGQLVCWGDGESGRLGLGDIEEDPPLARRPEQVGEAEDWEGVELGGAHSCAQRAGELHCFGANAQGQVGSGNTDDQLAPVRAGTLSFTVLSAGGAHTCGLADDLLHCWGDNAKGQAGLADATHADEPTRVEDAAGWSAVSAGAVHTCGVRSGTLLCWGDNANGQLGLAGAEPRAVPTVVGTDNDWIAVAAGDRHTCGLRGAGSLFCWGDNASGQLGVGDSDPREQPTAVGSDIDWTTVVAGGAHTCGMRGGMLLCWGSNEHGQLSMANDVASSPEPSVVSPLGSDSFETIALAANQSCAIAAGQLFCWGDNTSNRLGVAGADPFKAIELVR